MRKQTELSAYNRAVAFHCKPDGVKMNDNVLGALATNELQLMYVFARLAGVTDVGYTMHGCKKTGDAFKRPTQARVDAAAKWVRR